MAVDARIARTRTTVLRAATELLVEGGPSAVTVDAIVARSGVAKSTIYRHWESRDEILTDVMDECAPTLHVPEPDLPFEPSLRQLMGEVIDAFADPEWARMVPSLILLKRHTDGVANLDERLHYRQTVVVSDVLDRGVREGRLPADYDLEEATAQLVGPVFFAQISNSVAIDRAYGDRVVDRFLAAFRPADVSER
jgi:AcrR family transcriptional regulator